MDLFIPGPEGPLEALFHEALGVANSAEPRAVAVVCHPHPALGGNMNSTVAFRIARGLQRAGIACARFNFRGVGQSAGQYDGEGAEEEDVRAVLDWLHERFPVAPLWAAGFSFGSRTVFGLALRDRSIERLVLAGFPARVYPQDRVDTLSIPAFFLWGSEDEFGTLSDLRKQYPHLPKHFDYQEVQGADHFFRPRTKEVEEHVFAYAARVLGLETQDPSKA